LVSRADIESARRIFQVNCLGTFRAAGCEIIQGADGEPVEPGFQSEALRLIETVAQSARDRLVYYFFPGHEVWRQRIRALAVLNLTFYETFQPDQVGIHEASHVVGRNGGCLNRRDGFLERNSGRLGTSVPRPAPCPFVRAAQQVLMLGELLEQIIKSGFEGS